MMLPVKNCKTLLLAAMLIGAVSTAYAGTPCGDNLEYEIDGTTLVLTSPDPTLPATIENSAFKDNTTITAVAIPSNVTWVGSQAFMGCTALADVDLGNVSVIHSEAFRQCTALTEIVLPPSVTSIGNYAFYGCSSLQWVFCRPQTPPTLDPSGNIFISCADDLVFCVPQLSYRSAAGWSFYDSGMFKLCHLDENDTNTNDKISAFRTASRTSIDLFRTLRKAGCFNTLTLPFTVPDIASSPLAGDNVEVYTFVGATVSDGELQLDITPLVGSSLTAGTPYLIQWANTGEVMTHLTFSGISWDDDQTAEDAGTGDVLFHGFYGKTHINDQTENGDNVDGTEHFNLFLGGNNTLYWPSDGAAPDAKMLGFRAWFNITAAPGAKNSIRRGMPATLRIVSTTTDIERIESSAVSVQKELRDGKIIIIRNGESYFITGQKL